MSNSKDNNSFLVLKVHNFEGKNANINNGETSIILNNGEVTNVAFIYDVTEKNHRGKSLSDTRTLEITINLDQVRVNDKANGTNNIELLNKWKATTYVDDTKTKDKYYKVMGIECWFNDLMERKIVLYNAYLDGSSQTNKNNNSLLKICVRQKDDKQTKIGIFPYSIEYKPSESQIITTVPNQTTPTPTETDSNTRYIGLEYLAIFKEASLDSEVLKVMNFKESVEVDKNGSENSKFIKITSPCTGYIFRVKDDLYSKQSTGTYDNSKFKKVRSSKIKQWIYALPDSKSNKVYEIKANDKIVLLGTAGITSGSGNNEATWIKCKYVYSDNSGSKGGWINRGQLEEVKNSIIENLRADNSLGKKEITILVAEKLIEAKFEETFIAGVLANILHEGDIGYFEGSNYKSNPSEKPKYLIYIWIKMKIMQRNTHLIIYMILE